MAYFQPYVDNTDISKFLKRPRQESISFSEKFIGMLVSYYLTIITVQSLLEYFCDVIICVKFNSSLEQLDLCKLVLT